MRNIVLGSEQDLWWNWAVAELDSARFGDAFRRWIPTDLQTRVLANRRDDLTVDDWAQLKTAVLNVRFPILLDLLLLGTDWYLGDLDSIELPSLRVMNYEPHVRLAPSRNLAALAKELDAGRNPPGEDEFGNNYRTIRDAFLLDRARGRPILVAEDSSGPFTMLEGYTRMTAMTSLAAAERIHIPSVPILLGVCPRLHDWHQYGVWQGRLLRTERSLF